MAHRFATLERRGKGQNASAPNPSTGAFHRAIHKDKVNALEIAPQLPT